MAVTQMMSGRIDTLEMRIAQQDQIIEDLNATVTAQWRHIDGLARQVSQLEDRLRDIASSGGSRTEPPPPHY